MAEVVQIDKRRVASQFSRAAQHYDDLAHIQRHIAQQAISSLPDLCGTLLDVGCGSGLITAQLAPRCRNVVAIDLAEGMLEVASRASSDDILWLAGDAEAIPLQTHSVDTVFSNMALQWCGDLPAVYRELYRVMRPGARAVLAIVCDGSMQELQHSWLAVDRQPHVNQFPGAPLLLQYAKDSGFLVEQETRRYRDWFADIRGLLRSIKGVGANVVNATGNRVQVKRNTLHELECSYRHHFAENDQLPLSYQICHQLLIKG